VIQEEGSIFWEMAVSVTVRKIISFEHVPNFEWLPRYSCFSLHIKKSIVNGNKKANLLTIMFILILI
jgi:hypothetical protein